MINMIRKENILNIIKTKKDLNEIMNEIIDNKVSKYFNNDSKFGFDNMTCTLIKLKNN